MHEPRPHGLSAVGGEPTEEDSAAVELLARRLTNLRNLSGVDSLRMVRELPGGGYVIAQNMGGVFKAITHKPGAQPEPEPFDGIAKDYIPMLFSGAITRGIVNEGRGVRLKLTEQCRKRIAGYTNRNLPAKDVELQRFVVDYHTQVYELEPYPKPAVTKFTQYVDHRPTWYSGAMAEVMQIVGGYGRQDLEELPDTRIERARLLLPEKYKRKILDEMGGNVRLPGYTGFPDKKGQFKYDYKFNNTNGVGFDEENKPWLLRVSQAGVYAMPLPLVPATTTKAFRKWVEDVGDSEILAVVDRFGGMPSGETFPFIAESFEAWRRAGVIIKVCDTSDFYQHIMYSSAIGWSFNSKGSEGYNTCYDYYDEEGLGYGLAYKMSLTLGSAKNSGKLPPSFDLDSSENARRLDAYLSDLYRQMSDNDSEHLAIKYKLRRIPVSEILARAREGVSGKAELDYWNRKELEPIAVHSGSVSEVSRGYLYHQADFMFQPQIKYPEPFAGGCVSHDFLPLVNGRYKESYPNSDTIMFGYYTGDKLNVVKYFFDGRKYDAVTESDFEPCMTVGSWTKVETFGKSSLSGHFHISDIDERMALAPTVRTTRIIGQDKGYGAKHGHTPLYSWAMTGNIYRIRFYSHKTTVTETQNNMFEVGICIPYLNRNSAIHAGHLSNSGESVKESMKMLSVVDPNMYEYFTVHPVAAWAATPAVEWWKDKVEPIPKDGNPVYAAYFYNTSRVSDCSDFADQGPWLGTGFPIDVTHFYNPMEVGFGVGFSVPVPSLNEYSTSTNGEPKSSGSIKYSFKDTAESVHNRVPSTAYFLGSPDPYVGVFYRDATSVVFGESVYANVSESETEGGGRRKHWGSTSLADSKSAHFFIGVINE